MPATLAPNPRPQPSRSFHGCREPNYVCPSNPLRGAARNSPPARSKGCLADLEEAIQEFTWKRPYEAVVEPHATKADHKVHKIRLTASLLPIIADTCGEIVQGLRSSLDNATYAIAVASGKTDPKHCAFPFARSRHQMANALGRSKDLPPAIQSLLVGFQPFMCCVTSKVNRLFVRPLLFRHTADADTRIAIFLLEECSFPPLLRRGLRRYMTRGFVVLTGNRSRNTASTASRFPDQKRDEAIRPLTGTDLRGAGFPPALRLPQKSARIG